MEYFPLKKRKKKKEGKNLLFFQVNISASHLTQLNAKIHHSDLGQALMYLCFICSAHFKTLLQIYSIWNEIIKTSKKNQKLFRHRQSMTLLTITI